MKKLLSILGAAAILGSSASNVVACNSDDELSVVFIPSNNATEIINTVKPLEDKLSAKLKEKAEADGRTFSKKVKVSVSTSYEVAGNELSDGTIDVAFLPIGTYESIRGTLDQSTGLYSNAAVLLNASRSGVTPDTTLKEFKTNDKFDSSKASKVMDANLSYDLSNNYNNITKNGFSTKKEAQEKLLDDSNKASYYRSYIYANVKSLSDKYKIDFSKVAKEEYVTKLKDIFTNENNFTGENALKFAFGKSKTSSASALYPIMWLKNVIGLNDTQVKKLWDLKTRQESYPEAASKLNSQSFDFAVGYSDIRNEISNESESLEAFKNTVVVGASDAILNDGIQYSRKKLKDEKLISDLRKSFEELAISEADIFKIYNHTGYVGPDEGSVTDFEKSTDSAITNWSKTTSEILKMIENWS
ncbi:lipoprotein [Spiroplasma tabanidicola]|uniref:Phosphonate transport system substrate-binding protein n=1 Tax=Spiroplasma tabanidicola TaxID=324079 RepID=A0A6I6C680_9MOLU|nr:lipoprotein [Spiroplasma tabanidicola]QGS51660.1 phosphonate transport system substrate-binding protein [Spiroplasma tabanidicola]